MDFTKFASDLPSDRTLEFEAAEEIEETLRRAGVDQPTRQLGPGRFRAAVAVRETPLCELISDRYSTAMAMYLAPHAGHVTLTIPRTTGGECLASGQTVGNDNLLVAFENSGSEIVVPDLVGSENIVLPRTRFIELFEVLCPSSDPLEVMTVIEGKPEQLNGLRTRISELVSDPAANTDSERLSDLLAATIVWMGQTTGKWPLSGRKGARTRRRVAKRAREYIEAYYREAIRLEDLCRVTNVGVRTLQRNFTRYFGVTISDYVKTVRLDAARRELAAGNPSEKSVTGVALRHGLNHLGRFAADFRDRYGESPRELLARRPN